MVLPLAIQPVVPVYNLPVIAAAGGSNLLFTSEVLAQIFTGNITVSQALSLSSFRCSCCLIVVAVVG